MVVVCGYYSYFRNVKCGKQSWGEGDIGWDVIVDLWVIFSLIGDEFQFGQKFQCLGGMVD